MAKTKIKSDKKIIHNYKMAQAFEVLQVIDNIDFLYRSQQMRQTELKNSNDDREILYNSNTNMKCKNNVLLKDTNGKIPPGINKLLKEQLILYKDFRTLTKEKPNITKIPSNNNITAEDWSVETIFKMFNPINNTQNNNNNSEEDDSSVRTELLE